MANGVMGGKGNEVGGDEEVKAKIAWNPLGKRAKICMPRLGKISFG
jgi:hypothetical protein